MKIKKEHITGIILVLVTAAILCDISGCRHSEEISQPDKQPYAMPVINMPYDAGLDDIMFVSLQTDAVATDMYLYLGWFSEEKKMLKDASVKARNDLQTIKEYLQKLNFTPQLAELKESSLIIADRLTQIYDGIDLKKPEAIDESFTELNSLNSQYSEKLGQAIRQNMPAKKLPKDFDSKMEDVKLALNQQDGQAYLNAVELIKNSDYDSAYKGLASLKEKYKDTAFGDCIEFRMSDCLLKAEPNDQNVCTFNPEGGIELLSGILDSKKYSPVLFEAFYKWRTQTQSFWHGMSNMSQIPNWQYNLKRWDAVQTIRQYLKTNPQDIWAKAQAGLLLSLPNIGRGGAFGNDNLSIWGELYMDNDPNEK